MQWNEFRVHVRHLSLRDLPRVMEAFELGERVHRGQKRKSGEPYFTHPVAVAHMLADMGADAETIIAALLHDTIEDTDLTLDDIARNFDGNVTMLIEGVTKLDQDDVKDRPSLNEQIETLRKMFTLMERDIRIMVIKLIDRLHNMQTAEFLAPEKRRLLAKETQEVYVRIADRLCMQDVRDELENLTTAILEPEAFEKLARLRSQGEERSEEIIAQLQSKIADGKKGGKIDIRHEPKSWENLRRQLQNDGTAATGISTLTAVLVCPTVADCYRILGVLHQNWRREILSFQDYINSPAVNGYRGLHTTIILEDGTRVRCKIRTEEMQEYARKGVTSFCFRVDPIKLVEHLPWTARISPLAQDATERSQEFWRSLQSDILGESINIHGPGDETIAVPQGATVLDGAFYLFDGNALNVGSLRMDGKDVPFFTPLTHGATLDATLVPTPTVNHSWLQWVNTGTATASIRASLAEKMSPQEKQVLGKTMLQQTLREENKGFIEEFDEQQLSGSMRKLGYSSLAELYTAIAEGRLDLPMVYHALFSLPNPTTSRKPRKDFKRYRIHCSIDGDTIGTMHRFVDVYQRYGDYVRDVRMIQGKNGGASKIVYLMEFSEEDKTGFTTALETAGGKNMEVITESKSHYALMAAVIVPWALNPVIAKWLLTNGLQPLPLITIRLLTFSLFSICFFGVWRFLRKTAYSPIPRLPLLALTPALGNAAMSLTTYVALLFMPPSIHLTLLRFNTFLVPFLSDRRKNRATSYLIIFLTLLSGASLLLLFTLGWSYVTGIALSILTLLCYTFYSLSTERTLQQNRIDLRYPYLLLHMGIILGIIGAGLLVFQNPETLHHALALPAFAYVLMCVCIPHAAYTALLKTTRFKHFTDMLLIEVPVAMMLENLILGIQLPLAAYAAVAVILMVLLLLRWERIQIRM